MDDFIEDEEEDLYSDLPNFKYDETVDKLQASNKELQSRVLFLEDELDKQTKELDGIRSQCDTLTKNISSLLKTAQNEVKRKDNKITELNKLVIELKTEVLTLKKRKYDGVNSGHNEEPASKQQKIDNISSVKSTISQFFCNPEIIEKSTNAEETEESKMVMPERQRAPDIKLHTVYSKRMYDKIYNTGKVDSNINTQKEETKNNHIVLENKVEVKVSNKLEDKNISLPKAKIPNERAGDEQLDQPTFHLIKEKETNVNSLKNSNAVCVKTSNPLFNSFRNESLDKDNNKARHEKTPSDINKIVSVSGTKCIELNKELGSQCCVASPSRETSSSHNFNDQTIKNKSPAQGNKRVFISRMNRSSNFPKTDNSSKDAFIKIKQDSKISSVLNNDKVSNTEKLKIIEKTNVISDKIHVQSNEISTSSPKENISSHFSKSYSLKKSKKSIKSVICPISGEWAKNSEAASHSSVSEIDLNKKGSPNSKKKNEDLDIMECLFGSPLKWTENSFDDSKPAEKLSPATAFEDSCSAHIENLKFKETRNNVTEISETKITELSLTKKFSFTERKCYFQPTEVDNDLPKFNVEKKSDISLSKDVIKQSSITHWPFKKTNNEIPLKNRQVTSPTFSTFVNTESTSEACDVPSSLKSNPNTLEIVNPSTKFLRSPKYNDSVLGQFDDTTQLINALAKDTSKLSPIHTPRKETKSDDTSAKILPEPVENCVAKPLGASVDKNLLVPSDTDENKLTHKEPTSSVDEKKSEPIPKSIMMNKKPFKSNIGEKKMSDTKPLVSTVEKKLSIPASVISSVEKKLSFPFSLLSPVDKKIEKKTILLEQPINILCPRKTPRQVSCRQNILSKKQNAAKDKSKNSKVEVNSIKSPSPPPIKEKQSKIESRSTPETAAAVVSNKNLEEDRNDLKNHNTNSTSSKVEHHRKSKSPGNSKKENSKNNTSRLVSEERKTVPTKTPCKKDRSPVREKTKHSCSRKENVPHRREYRSPPSVKESSPSRFRKDHWQVRRESKPVIFKRPLARRESFKRPNCYFRQSSVERKIAKDLRHSSKTRTFSVKNGNLSESSRMNNCRLNKSSYNSNSTGIKERQFSSPAKPPLISRSSRISWSSSTSLIVSTKHSKNGTTPPPSEMKWVLRPIDFGQTPSLKESSVKSISETSINTSVSGSKTEAETPISKFLHATESSSSTSERCSPGKAIVIVAERRPIKFGSNN